MRTLAPLFSLVVNVALATTANAQVELIGKVTFPGNDADASGLTESLTQDIPHNRLGGFSGIEYTGEGDRYYVLSDRGFGDGVTEYRCRFHVVEVRVKPGQQRAVEASLVSTTLLTNEAGKPFVGSTGAFDATSPAHSMRLDPEAIRIGRDGNLLISDEYGPHLFAFSPNGGRESILPIPAHYAIARPSADPDEEDELNRTGRRANRGLEGLAVTESGAVVGLLQGPLLQDSLDESGKLAAGRNVRLVHIDETGRTRELVYQLDDSSNKLNELLAINEHEFLVIERDGKDGRKAAFKKIVKTDLRDATDVSDVDSLPLDELPTGVVPVAKSPFIDLLDPGYGLAGKDFPEKIEGLAFGPPLADGRSTLLVTSDNDFVADAASCIYVFAID